VAVVPPEGGKPLEITLPEPIAVRGRVSVGGKPWGGSPGRIRVLAARVGDRRTQSILSVDTTAQADGAFELAGLTAGKYEVQAALDDAWLSPTAAVTVPRADAAPLALSIPAPGGPVVVKLRDADGQPARGRAITVARPPGPLTRSLWPTKFVTDGAGEARIPALEVGRHEVHVADTEVRGTVDVAPVAGAEPGRLDLKVP
jgi:hypothetical protein